MAIKISVSNDLRSSIVLSFSIAAYVKCLLNIGLLNTKPKQSETRAFRNNLLFRVPVEKKSFHTGYATSKTLHEQSMNADQKSLQPVFSIDNCRQSGDLCQSKTLCFYYFWSTFVDNIDVFDCHLSGVNSLYAS